MLPYPCQQVYIRLTQFDPTSLSIPAREVRLSEYWNAPQTGYTLPRGCEAEGSAIVMRGHPVSRRSLTGWPRNTGSDWCCNALDPPGVDCDHGADHCVSPGDVEAIRVLAVDFSPGRDKMQSAGRTMTAAVAVVRYLPRPSRLVEPINVDAAFWAARYVVERGDGLAVSLLPCHLADVSVGCASDHAGFLRLAATLCAEAVPMYFYFLCLAHPTGKSTCQRTPGLR